MEDTYRKIDMAKLSKRKKYIISSAEALKDIIPVKWSDKVKSGEKKVAILNA